MLDARLLASSCLPPAAETALAWSTLGLGPCNDVCRRGIIIHPASITRCRASSRSVGVMNSQLLVASRQFRAYRTRPWRALSVADEAFTLHTSSSSAIIMDAGTEIDGPCRSSHTQALKRTSSEYIYFGKQPFHRPTADRQPTDGIVRRD